MKKQQDRRKEYKLRHFAFEFCRSGPEKMLRKVLLAIGLAVMVFAAVGCKTVQGIGGDITWVGKKGQQIVER